MKIITEKSVTLFKDFIPTVVASDHKNFIKIRALAIADKIDDALALVSIKAEVGRIVEGTEFMLVEQGISFQGYDIPEVIGRRILQLEDDGFNLKPLENFCRKLFANPRIEVVQELYLFLEASKLPLTPDGDFIAYKGVGSDFMDRHSGTIDNAVGCTPSMRPCDVDTDRDTTCSVGLHFAAYEYAHNWAGSAGHLMAVKVNPAEVVAIPSDYDNTKGRAWRYEVVEHVIDRTDFLESLAIYEGEEPSPDDKDGVECDDPYKEYDEYEKYGADDDDDFAGVDDI